MLADREHTGRAVLRCVQDGDGGRSGALFGARADALNGRRQQGVRDVKTAKSASSSVRRTGQRGRFCRSRLFLHAGKAEQARNGPNLLLRSTIVPRPHIEQTSTGVALSPLTVT